MTAEVTLHDPFAGEWVSFRDAEMVLAATALSEVLPVIEQLEAMLQRGFYAAGFVSYEAAPAFDPALHAPHISDFPLCWFGIYSRPQPLDLSQLQRRSYRVGSWQASIDAQRYREDIDRIKCYIAAGDSYQVNYTYRMFAPFAGDALSFFLDLNRNQPTEFAAFADIGDIAVCSVSPELFFRLDGALLTSRPMKGTASRGRYPAEDRARAEWLRNSQKNRAENTMIVDMIRNDFGRIAATGSVTVPSAYDIERYPTAWQMTSTVTARSSASPAQILAALFPCASITGAPKARTMAIIGELETTPRKLYTGAIGFFDPQRRAQFNVAIRTVLIDRRSSRAEYGVGGGIVWDSAADEEFAETRTKAKVLTAKGVAFDLLETLLWAPPEGYFLRDEHLQRMKDSAEYFGYPFPDAALAAALNAIAAQFPGESRRVRLCLDRTGKVSCQSAAFRSPPPDSRVRLALAATPVDSANPLLYHKTTKRDIYETARQSAPEADDVILYNERGELTETTIYNLVLKIGGRLLTPPLESGLLPGTFRAWLLGQRIIAEQTLTIADLERCEAVYVINALRKWQRAIVAWGMGHGAWRNPCP